MGIRINGSTSGYTEINAPAEGGNSTAGIILPSGTTAERPASGSAGQIRFNTDTGELEFYAPNRSSPGWYPLTERGIDPLNVEYLVVGGGGGGGGYTPHSSPGAYFAGTTGSDSIFDTVTAGGGGGGGDGNGGLGLTGRPTNGNGGGSSGGTAQGGGAGNGSGYGGGAAVASGSYAGGSGGGAGAAGTNGGTGVASNNGGIGATTTIITTAQATANSVGEVDSGNVYFAGGGASSPYTYYASTPANGGLGGGGDSVTAAYAGYGATNTGHGTTNTGGGGAGYTNNTYGSAGGGAGGVVTGTINAFPTGQPKPIVVGEGGAGDTAGNSSNGGSGVVILKYPSVYTATFSAGVTQTTITDGGNKISIVKATTNSSQTVTFS